MESSGRATLARESIEEANMQFVRQVDMRYVGQSFELSIPLSTNSDMTPGLVAQALGQFHEAHERAYGFNAPGEPVELVNLRLTAVGKISKPQLRELPAGSEDGVDEKGRRQVYFAESGGFVDCPIYDRYRLRSGAVIAGPAIVEEFDSTTVIHPGYVARVDRFGNLLLTK
jgi:N-methylhydantoinase A